MPPERVVTTWSVDALPARAEAGRAVGARAPAAGHGFTAVNYTPGHRVGDRLPAAVAERLTRVADEAGPATWSGTIRMWLSL
ncbi:hypothetical protein ABZX30_03755 [Streptomyces sp. NPDC004542]|uniref:hypothetical protein n=1 Tax=Streptomyces sp. NPDC004542 TaxID=3154281 RepID=UPI0033BDF678